MFFFVFSAYFETEEDYIIISKQSEKRLLLRAVNANILNIIGLRAFGVMNVWNAEAGLK